MRGSVPGYSLRRTILVVAAIRTTPSARLKAPETGWWFETTFIPIVMQPAAIRRRKRYPRMSFCTILILMRASSNRHFQRSGILTHEFYITLYRNGQVKCHKYVMKFLRYVLKSTNRGGNMGLLNSEVGETRMRRKDIVPDWQMRLFLTGLLVLLTLSTVPITLAGCNSSNTSIPTFSSSGNINTVTIGGNTITLTTNRLNQDVCFVCHKVSTPGIIEQFKSSLMAQNGVTCTDCHQVASGYPGAQTHNGTFRLASPTPAMCQKCHSTEVTQFTRAAIRFRHTWLLTVSAV